jgi:L-aspartate oxidase
MKENLEFDAVIIGSGLSGIYTALSLDGRLKIAILSIGSIAGTNSYLAQGGVAAAVGKHDSSLSHYQDTMVCGHQVNDEAAVKQLTNYAKEEIDQLMSLGVKFNQNPDGSFQFGMEGAHSIPRILRIGDYTGKAIMETLWQRVLERKNITILDDAVVYNLTNIQTDFKVLDVLSCEKRIRIVAKSVVIATGGLGRLYNRTSNNINITGDGAALAINAGISVKHLNWIQFHPTVFFNTVGEQEGFLISEAVRGDGGILLNEHEERFMTKYHHKLELAPRDIVSSAIHIEIQKQSNPFVWLDVRHIGNEKMSLRFPTIYAYCCSHGLNLEKDLIPVAPGAHYAMGGIEVDLDGRTSCEGIYAVGECAYTGVHGKNRLASNSLLEAIVFAKKTAQAINRATSRDSIYHLSGSQTEFLGVHTVENMPFYEIELPELAKWMDANMGIVKNIPEIEAMYEKLGNLLHSPQKFSEIDRIIIKKNNALIVLKEMLSHVLREKDYE